jgi:hypothetical protein
MLPSPTKLSPRELVELRKRQDGPWLLLLCSACFGPFVIAIVALTAPRDVLTQFPMFALYCKSMVEWFPFLGWHARVSRFPEVTTLVKCLSFIFIPLTTIAIALYFWSQRTADRLRYLYRIHPKPPVWQVPFFALLVPIVFGANWLLVGDPTIASGLTTKSRIGLAIIDACAPIAVAVGLVMPVWTIYIRSVVSAYRV